MSRKPVITYRRDYRVPQPPLRTCGTRSGRSTSSKKLVVLARGVPTRGERLQKGSVLHGVVAPPLPYRMRIEVEVTECWAPRRMEALIHGDLEGEASLDIRPVGTGSSVEVAWTVEMKQRPMRLADRMAHPLLQWGHDRVVEITVAGFRRRLGAADT